jgi:hypothetical protein
MAVMDSIQTPHQISGTPSAGLRVRTGLTAGGTVQVYGSTDCSWTRKQLDYLKKKNIPYAFIDCSTQTCPDFVNGFPTIVKDGQVFVGYTQF